MAVDMFTLWHLSLVHQARGQGVASAGNSGMECNEAEDIHKYGTCSHMQIAAQQ